jgi:hypothetical protein
LLFFSPFLIPINPGHYLGHGKDLSAPSLGKKDSALFRSVRLRGPRPRDSRRMRRRSTAAARGSSTPAPLTCHRRPAPTATTPAPCGQKRYQTSKAPFGTAPLHQRSHFCVFQLHEQLYRWS